MIEQQTALDLFFALKETSKALADLQREKKIGNGVEGRWLNVLARAQREIAGEWKNRENGWM